MAISLLLPYLGQTTLNAIDANHHLADGVLPARDLLPYGNSY
jgi:hypothetical protein